MSGGGHCNFTNRHIDPEYYISSNLHFVKLALSSHTQWDFVTLVEKHGIAYHEKTLGQLFCDKSSKQILGMLLTECEEAGGKDPNALPNQVCRAIERWVSPADLARRLTVTVWWWRLVGYRFQPWARWGLVTSLLSNSVWMCLIDRQRLSSKFQRSMEISVRASCWFVD